MDSRVMQGDCLEVMAGIPDGSIDLVLADPPYGTTNCKWDSVIPFGPMWEQLKRVTKPNGAIVMTASQPFTTMLIASNIELFRYCWVWEKNRATNFLNAKKAPLKAHEDIIVFGEGALRYNPQKTKGHPPTHARRGTYHGPVYNGPLVRNYPGGNTDRYPRSVQFFKSERGLMPTQKPVPLMEYLIKTYTNEGETVLDFAMGSGTAGVACVNTGRDFIGIELDEGRFGAADRRIKDARLAKLWA